MAAGGRINPWDYWPACVSVLGRGRMVSSAGRRALYCTQLLCAPAWREQEIQAAQAKARAKEEVERAKAEAQAQVDMDRADGEALPEGDPPEPERTSVLDTVASKLDTATTVVGKVGEACEALEKAAGGGKYALLDQFAGAHSDVVGVVAGVAEYAPVVGKVLKAADAICKVVKAMQELPAAVDDFFRQVVTANRVLRSAFAGIPQLTLEA